MGVRPYNDARAEANARYDAKTYTQANIRLRKEDDADIIKSLEEARTKGMTNREWIRELFDNQK